MTILHLTPRYWPDQGGVETHVREVVRELISRGHQVIVVTEQTDLRQSLQETHEGVTIIRVPLAAGETPYKQHVWNWIRAHRNFFDGADVLQVHDIFWWLLPIYFSVRQKVFTTFHGWEGKFPIRWQAQLQRFMNNHFSQGSLHVGDWIREYYWDTPDAVIYGAPTHHALVGAENITKKRKKSEPLRLMFVGRLVAENDVFLYVELVNELQRRGVNVVMRWVGDGPLRSLAEEVGEVLGWQTKVSESIKTADMVLANSYLSMWEALAAGKPVIALYSHPLKQRYLETFPAQTAVVVGNDPRRVAAQINELWQSKKELAKCEQAALTEANNHSWEKITDVYEALWRTRGARLRRPRVAEGAPQARLSSPAPTKRAELPNQKVSVIVTIWNERTTIEPLIQSLATQTKKPDEVIIVDGGSIDGTWELLQTLKQKYPSITLKPLQKKGNRSVGRNYAIEQAKNDLIAITDAGCIAQTNWLEELLRTAKESKAEVVSGYAVAAPKTAFEAAVVPYVLVMPDRVDQQNFLPATRSMLIQKKVWSELGGFDESLSHNEDYAFAKKIERAGYMRVFNQNATVIWQPRKNLRQFAHMIYRFAVGDMESGIVRPKVVLIFLRYIVGISLISLLLLQRKAEIAAVFTGVATFLYTLWSIQKNRKYVGAGLVWLPVLQIVSDVMVMLGSVVGFFKKK